MRILKLLLIAGLLILSYPKLHGQKRVLLKGKVTDSLGEPVVYATTVADGKNFNDVQYTFTDEQGIFQLKVLSGKTYILSIQSLGKARFVQEFIVKKDTMVNIKMQEQVEQLKKVTIRYTPPVRIKEDTIIFNKKAFASGDERKLREILKKMPGFEVDDLGNVTFQGRKIKKLLVENREFFFGDPKLGVNYIPAKAVKDVQIIDNYQDVPIMKGMISSDDLAMNIKLKKNYKQFAFGDVEGGFGPEDKYVFHPSLYYFSTGWYGNILTDINNAGERFFTFRDFIKISRGKPKYFETNIAGSFFQNREVSKLLTSGNKFKEDYKLFLAQAGNHKRDFNYSFTHLTFQTYDATYRTNQKVYLNQPYEEFQESKTLNNQLANVEKLVIRYNPNLTRYIRADLSYTWSGGKRIITEDFINSFSHSTTKRENHIQSKIFNAQLQSYLRHKKNVYTALLQWDIKKDISPSGYLSDNPSFLFLPYNTGLSNYHVSEKRGYKQNKLRLSLKYYYRLNRDHVFGLETGYHQSHEKLNIGYEQILPSGQKVSFADTIGLNTLLNQKTFFTRLTYKLLFKNWEIELSSGGDFYQRFLVNQEKEFSYQPFMFVPSLKIKRKKGAFSYRINYEKRFEWPDVYQMTPQYYMESAWSFVHGNPHLLPGINHHLRLMILYFNISSGWIWSIIGFQQKQVQTILPDRIFLNGLPGQTYTVIPTDDYFISYTGSINYSENPFRYGIGFNFSKSLAKQLWLGDLYRFNHQSQGINLSIRSIGRRSIEFGTNYSFRISNNSSDRADIPVRLHTHQIFGDILLRISSSFSISYKHKWFYNIYLHENNSNSYHQNNMEIRIQPENDPWSVRLVWKNISGTPYRIQNTLNDFYKQYTKQALFPPVFLFVVSYQL